MNDVTDDITVRHERPGDGAAVRRVNELAFGRPNEADLVDRLRDSFRLLSLVAEAADGEIAGHVLFTVATLRVRDHEVVGSALGPVAVLPARQRRGIGGRLIRAGMGEIGRRGDPFVIVLGHPAYYPRFGFEPAGSRHGLRCKWDVPDDVFMIRVFNAHMLGDVRGGLAMYQPAFDAV